MKHIEIQPKLFLYIFLAFIGCTIIGTLSHEYGHIAVAQSLGYKTTLSYQSMHVDRKAEKAELHRLAYPYLNEIKNKQPYPAKAAVDAKCRQMHRNDLWIRLGGPLQTMLTGTIGFCILWYRRKKSRAALFHINDWIFVFLAFFWIRQPSNILHSFGYKIITGKGHWIGGDEWYISYYLKVPLWTASVITGIIGLLIVAYVIFAVIPKKYRLTFLTAGITGGVAGFLLWMDYLGPYLLP
ncbi:hypothetical protein [Flavobacterium pallidum]|uniref:Uncharacterized protein n=1 Tax=Flavobacterium pallidum TaxID=2172098 RepID=A0A2S1SHR5_9FLAO|nr:hypothetical protein [Flavobacterium pallidum]AWI25954.1 hypothetical protein HYN49_08600 [Flavobacterium pallidum]